MKTKKTARKIYKLWDIDGTFGIPKSQDKEEIMKRLIKCFNKNKYNFAGQIREHKDIIKFEKEKNG